MRTIIILLLLSSPLFAAEPKVQPKKQAADFKWVTPLPEGRYPGLRHATFDSTSNGVKVGYCIYLPPGYDDPENQDRRYPVVYWLHGGRPGGEPKGISLTPFIHEAMKKGKVPPMIYVFPNGGVVSHYDYPKLKSLGETAFIKELDPAHRQDVPDHRLQGRSSRRRLFAGRSGHGPLYVQISGTVLLRGSDGRRASARETHLGEQRRRRRVSVRAEEQHLRPRRKYAADSKSPLRILVVVGDKDMNYQANLEWMDHLRSLKIPFEHRIVDGVPHSTQLVYEKVGLEVMKFHADNFKKTVK